MSQHNAARRRLLHLCAMVLDTPTRSFTDSTPVERLVGFLAASVFSITYVAAPLNVLAALFCLTRWPSWWVTWLMHSPLILSCLTPSSFHARFSHALLTSWPMQQIPKYFAYEEYHETPDSEMRAAGKNFIIGAHPHGVFSFAGVCAAVVTHNAQDGFGAALFKEAPTAAASVIKVFPVLKDVLGIFGIIDAGSSTLSKRLAKPMGSFVLYIGGMIELFRSSSKREAVFLKQRKGFIKLALRSGADVIPIYMFGNTTVLSALTWGPLASLSRTLGVSVTVFWGRFGLPLPKPVQITYARGRPLGMPHIENPTNEDIEKWHAVYCQKLKELFDAYKGRNPDYKHKELIIE
eukprot:gb/GFBE01045235.1/.p1 GENE.gb/GFBE01045235.1/~~gb/GFBE01045235.1/.p1  ORF type:complete len:349 (+),score=46.12 gb/GFBE01045235.1/:1-1047(+)